MLRRHYLLEISEEGRRMAFGGVAPRFMAREIALVKELIIGKAQVAPIPGIVRREDGKSNPDTIPVGFSSPFRIDGNRLRIAAFVPAAQVINAISPFDLLQREYVPRTPCLQALVDISQVAEVIGLKLGVWGSAALEIATGLHYTDENSDLDLLISVAGIKTIRSFQEKCLVAAERFACKIDVEVDLPSGYGVKLAELFMNTETVLAKGLDDVILLPKCDVLTFMVEAIDKDIKIS